MNPHINEYSTKRWYNDAGQLHREDGPAIKRIDGSKEWFIDDIPIYCENNDEFLRIVKMKKLL
jgi:hypothetical protein